MAAAKMIFSRGGTDREISGSNIFPFLGFLESIGRPLCDGNLFLGELIVGERFTPDFNSIIYPLIKPYIDLA